MLHRFTRYRKPFQRLLSLLLLPLVVGTAALAAPPALEDFADGTQDATQALQQWIDSTEGALRLPEGTYRISEPLVIDLQKRGLTSLRGDGAAVLQMSAAGPALRILGSHFQSADPGGFNPRVWTDERMPLVDGLGITATHPQACGIEAAGTMQLTVTRCQLRNLLHGIHLVQNNRNVIISECHIYENRGVGLFLDDVNLHQINVTGCHISYNHQGGIVSKGGNVRNLHVSGCDLESNMDAAQEPSANVLIDCRSSEYGTGEVAITGCTIQHNSKSPGSANIRILGGSKSSASRPTQEGNITITGNVLSDVETNIHLVGCRGVAVAGNTLWQGYEYNLLFEDSTNLVLGANNLDRNPRYDYGDAESSKNRVRISHCADCTVTGLHVTQVKDAEAGVVLEHCQRMNMVGCTILDCGDVGILLRNVSHSRISDCLVDDEQHRETLTPVREIEGKMNRIDP